MEHRKWASGQITKPNTSDATSTKAATVVLGVEMVVCGVLV